MFFVLTKNENDVGYFIGEPFQQEELEEMLSAAVDPEKGSILYKEYVSRLAVEEV